MQNEKIIRYQPNDTHTMIHAKVLANNGAAFVDDYQDTGVS